MGKGEASSDLKGAQSKAALTQEEDDRGNWDNHCDLSIGQYGGLGPNKLFGRLAPAFKGLGYGMLYVTFLVAIYYNMIIAWTLFYTFAGMQSQLPWEFCGNDFNTLACYKKEMAEQCNNGTNGMSSYWNNTCTDVKDICSYYNLEHLPGQLDKQNFSMCYNGSHPISDRCRAKSTFSLKEILEDLGPHL